MARSSGAVARVRDGAISPRPSACADDETVIAFDIDAWNVVSVGIVSTSDRSVSRGLLQLWLKPFRNFTSKTQ